MFGILPLRIETGRYVGETPEQRVCLLCNNNSIENEIHFVLNCELYNNIRLNYLHEILSTEEYANMSDSDFVRIVKDHPRRLAKYLVASYLKRRENIYRR